MFFYFYLHSGFTGSVNAEDIDNPTADFTPFTKVRNLQPPYTNTAQYVLVFSFAIYSVIEMKTFCIKNSWQGI